MGLFYEMSQYLIFVKKIFRYNTKAFIFFSQLLNDVYSIGVQSFFIISVLSTAVGFVSALQLVTMLAATIVPEPLIPIGIKNTILLEFAPTIMCFVFIGRNITAITCQLYDMKRSGYFDNLKVIGVDVISYGCLSKVCACTICFPLSTIFSCFFSILGGYMYCVFYSGMSSNIYMEALISYLNFHYITLCLVKSIVFGFLCGSVGSYLGFCFNKGNNLSMISISQHCFTVCCIVVLCGDIFINIIDTTFFKLPY